jgi:hypothetical protein
MRWAAKIDAWLHEVPEKSQSYPVSSSSKNKKSPTSSAIYDRNQLSSSVSSPRHINNLHAISFYPIVSPNPNRMVSHKCSQIYLPILRAVAVVNQHSGHRNGALSIASHMPVKMKIGIFLIRV